MKLSKADFRQSPNKAVTLLGMSGVGKTHLSRKLRSEHWFHYSGDYRIGTRYLDEPVLDNLKKQAMQVPFLRELLLSDSIHINTNLTIDNLQPVASFLGTLGNPELGGLPLAEFKRRQALHYKAEVATMLDVPDFIAKAQDIYGYTNFVNDAGGSLCELDNDEVLECLAEHTLILYIRATEQGRKEVIQRAESDPKPLFYREAFLDENLAEYLQEKNLEYVAMVDPKDFGRWVFQRLFDSRIPRYEKIVEKYGYAVSSTDIAQVRNGADFLDLIESLL